MPLLSILLAFQYLVVATATLKEPPARISLQFGHKVNGQDLVLGNIFNNSLNESYTINRFKYYVSNFTLRRPDGTEHHISDQYFLVNEEEADSKNISLPADTGSYTAISFTIGVDSLKNVSGTQTDALDPVNGMFWTWNTGYIMAKLEGTSTLSKAPNQMIEYHIGGFKSNENTLRTINLPFPSVVRVDDEKKIPRILIEADINYWFNGQHQLPIAAHPVCTTPGALAVSYANNCARMFKVASVGYEQ